MFKQILLDVLLRPTTASDRFSQNRAKQDERPQGAIGTSHGKGDLPGVLPGNSIGKDGHDFFWRAA